MSTTLPPRPRGVRRLLCVANYPANAGFAWDFIESLYAGLAKRLEPRRVETWVAYPEVREPPRALTESPAQWLEHHWDLRNGAGRRAARTLIRNSGFETLYLTDHASWDPAYAGLRRAGLAHLIVHDHTSGDRTRPTGLKRVLKKARHLLAPGAMANRVLAVSDFVAARKRAVDLVPDHRVVRVWNSVEVPETPYGADERARLRARFGIAPDRLLVACASRAHPQKGVAELFRAFDRLLEWDRGLPGPGTPMLLYMGEGPAMPALRELHGTLRHRDAIILAGYVPDAAAMVGAADVAVVPSLWAEAFGLAVLEPLARGVPVIASAVGGIPEVVRDGREGILVPPGDVAALRTALDTLLNADRLRREMGARGHARARDTFDRETQLDELEEIFVEVMGL